MSIMRDIVKLRYRLLPYIYAARSYTVRVHDGKGKIRTLDIPAKPTGRPLEITP